MAIFGTPTVIGTLTSSTSSTSYIVPITAITTLGDCIVVVVSSAGAGSNNIPSLVVDSQNTGQTYTQLTTTAGSGQLTYLRLYGSKVLTSADTVTVTFPAANTFLKSIAVIDCPGALADDLLSVATNSGTGTNPVVNTNLGYSYELVIFAQNNGNLGGAPSGLSPLTNLVTLHSGSAIFTNVSYQIVTSSGPFTATDTISSTGWSGLTVGMINSIPIFFNQAPYTTDSFYPTLVFNPSLQWAKLQSGQPPIPTVISSAPVNIQGAQANVWANGVNFLKGDAANFTSSIGNWTNGGNTTIAQTSSVSQNAQGALQATATGSGSLTVLSSTSGKIQSNGLPAQNGDSIFTAVWVLASTVGRNAQVGFSMLDANQNVLGSTIFGTSQLDSTGTWILLTATGTVNQANTAYVRTNVQWSSVGAAEVHYLSNAWMTNVSSGDGMGESIAIYTPSNQQFQLMPDGVPYPLSLNNSLQFLPRQIQTAPFAVFQPGAPATVAVSAPIGTPTVFQTFAQPFPWHQIMPGLQFIPSLNWAKQQISTSNAPTFIDGGQSANVTVNAQFPDMAVTVSISASPANVNVTAPTPPTVVTGVPSNVTVSAPAPTPVVSVTGVVANTSVSARAGSISSSLQGTVSSVTASSSGQKVTLGPIGNTASVNVSPPDGAIVVVETGGTANISVASTGTITSSVLGQVSNISVAARNGTVSESVVGSPAQVNVASTGVAVVNILGSAPNVNATAIPGTVVTGKFVSGVTANVVVSTIANAEVVLQGVASTITATSPAGNVLITVPGPTATVNVVAPTGFAGQISITATLVDPDDQMDQLLSRQGKLLEIPVDDMLISRTSPPLPQGI